MTRRLLARAFAGVACAALLAGCGLLESAPSPTPESFPGIASQLGRVGVTVSDWVSGDAGCADSSLSPTAIRFRAAGLDQASPVLLRIYIFRDRKTWERRRPDVDTCAAAWATDPVTFEFIAASPYVVAGQGPWAPGFHDALRQGITTAAGDGS